MRRSILQWGFAAVLFALSVSAEGPCDDSFPWYYSMEVLCEQADNICLMGSPVTVSVLSWNGTPRACATVEWTFGDGTPMVTAPGNEAVSHTYTTAGEYTINATFKTAATQGTSGDHATFKIANGLLRWSAARIVEGGPVPFAITRTVTAGATSFPWSIDDFEGETPTDITPTSGIVSFAPGQAVATLNLVTANDVIMKGNRRYRVKAGAVTGEFLLSSPFTTLDIEDDDYSLLAFSEAPVRVREDAGVAVVTLTRTGDLTARVSTRYTVDTNVSSPIVETVGELVFEPGQASRSFNVPIVDDDVWTGTATATIRLDNPTGGARYKSNHNDLIVEDDDDGGPEITSSESLFEEGDAGARLVSLKFTSTVPMQGELGIIVIDGTATRNIDYSLFSSALFFNGTSATLNLVIRGDVDPEADETFTLLFQRNWGTVVEPEPVTVTIDDDDIFFTPDRFHVLRGHSQQATLVVGGTSATPLVVPLTSSRPELLRVPPSVTIPAGANRVSFMMEGLEVGTTIRVTAGLPADRGGPQKIVGHVYEPRGVTFDPAVVQAYPGQEVPVKIAIDGNGGRTFDLPLHLRDAKIASAPAAVTILTDGTGAFTVKALKAGTTRIEVKQPGSPSEYATLEVIVADAPDTPAIASISPGTGPAAGGTAFVAPGSHLTADCTLAFGGVPSGETTLGADGTLHGVTPPHAAGTVDVVLTCGATTFVLTDAFTYLESPPALTSLSPTFGSTAGGTLVRATGANFQSGCWMFFDDVPATAVEVDSTTSLIAAVPPRASAGQVATSVRCGDGTATLPASYAYSSAAESAASIISIAPLVGAPGESVTITGSRFRADDGIDFDGTPATILRSRPDEHVVRIPELPLGMSSITVGDTAGRVTTTGPIFTIVEPVPPQIAGVSPAATLPGSEVKLRGRGFRPGYTFAVGGQPAQTIALGFDEVRIRLGDLTPAGTHPVHVLNAAGKVASVGGSVHVGGGALRIGAVVPACGFTDGGAAVTIGGAGFEPGATVTFNGIPATDVELVDAQQLRATAPASVTGPAVVVVKNANGDAASATRFTYFSPFQPNAGCAAGTRSRSARH